MNKFLLRHGRRPPIGVKAWTVKYLEWVRREVHFEQRAQEATLLDYLHEVEGYMRAWILALFLIAYPGVALTQDLTQNDAEHSVRLLLNELSAGYITGFAEKPIARLGDAAAVAVTQIFADREPTATEMYNILDVVKIAFARPSIVALDSERLPRTTLLLLRYMDALIINPDLKAKIADTRRFALEQTTSQTANPGNRAEP